jgi:uncharacterized membrane protein
VTNGVETAAMTREQQPGNPILFLEHELDRLREARRSRRAAQAQTALTPGQRAADAFASVIGSWSFIIVQTILLVLWLILNITAWIQRWDPYPFILLNLMLSFQAAYAGPIILMSQNRQADLDRRAAHDDAEVNLKAELEIELLHEKLDLLRSQEIARLIAIVERLEARNDVKG